MTSRRAGIEDVRFAYRLLLGREPDAAGFETYSRLIREQVLQPDELARYFLGSNEFRSRISDHVREVDLGGFILSVDANDNDVSRVIAQSQLWEPHVTAVLNEKLRPGGSFLDVGANIGYFTAWAAHRVGSSGRVVAVEPMDKNVQLICSTIERNGFAHVRVEPFAASDGSGIARMGTLEGLSNGQIERAWASGMRPLYVQTRRLDDLLSDDKGFDVVKFDIEGHEPYAFAGLFARIGARTFSPPDGIPSSMPPQQCTDRAGRIRRDVVQLRRRHRAAP